jgi:hypothetical protein
MVTRRDLFAALALQLPQSPSPMVENSRRHGRQTRRDTPGERIPLERGALLLPLKAKPGPLPLVVHFHSAPWLPEQSVRAVRPHAAALAVQIGAGSRAYAEPFAAPDALWQLLAPARREFSRVTLSGWSAGYGAIRAILSHPVNVPRVAGVMLLDGLHAGYEPPEDQRHPKLEDIRPFIDYARRAAAGQARMLITHSEIFPGTFASTTECTDALLAAAGIIRRPVVRWGPLGMQQISAARQGRFRLLGFAGNSAPDHIDHLHALPEWLRMLG